MSHKKDGTPFNSGLKYLESFFRYKILKESRSVLRKWTSRSPEHKTCIILQNDKTLFQYDVPPQTLFGRSVYGSGVIHISISKILFMEKDFIFFESDKSRFISVRIKSPRGEGCCKGRMGKRIVSFDVI